MVRLAKGGHEFWTINIENVVMQVSLFPLIVFKTKVTIQSTWILRLYYSAESINLFVQSCSSRMAFFYLSYTNWVCFCPEKQGICSCI